MNLSDLRYVAAVSATGRFWKAAALCCVTPAAVTRGVQRVEEELGLQLFQRAGNAKLLPIAHAEPVLDAIRIAVDSCAAIKSASRGTLQKVNEIDGEYATLSLTRSTVE